MIRILTPVLFWLSSHAINDADCGSTVSCFKQPAGCTLSTTNCQILSWVKSGNNWNFEITANVADNRYVAFAFSSGTQMADKGDTYVCKVVAGAASFESKYISTTAAPTSQSKSVTISASSSPTYASNKLNCKFTRPSSVTIESTAFDLAETMYVLAASGAVSGSALEYHGRPKRYQPTAKTDFNASPDTPTTVPVTTVPPATTPDASITDDTISKCGETVGCQNKPDNCKLGTKNCQYLSWTKAASKKRDTHSSFNLEITANVDDNTWVGYAFSNGQTMVSKGDVYICAVNSGTAEFQSLYFDSQNRPRSVTKSSVITATSTSYSNSVLKCKFTRPAVVTVDGTTFDISKEIYVLAARGSYAGGQIAMRQSRNNFFFHKVGILLFYYNF